jgi:hypothetical protein
MYTESESNISFSVSSSVASSISSTIQESAWNDNSAQRGSIEIERDDMNMPQRSSHGRRESQAVTFYWYKNKLWHIKR